MDHVVRLPEDWGLWSVSVLRGAGFPAATVLRLARPEVAAAARAAIEAERREEAARKLAIAAIRREEIASTGAHDAALARAKKLVRKRRAPTEDTGTAADVELAALRDAYAARLAAVATHAKAFEEARPEIARELRAAAADPRFREAVSWQNRSALERYEQAVARSGASGPRASDRRYDDLVLSYLHRYCTKNDTIGFFGPVGWARWSVAVDAIVARPGPTLLAHRSVHFEQWTIDALAQVFGADERMLPWAAPRRFGFIRLEGSTAHSPVSGRRELDPLEAWLLLRADGSVSARDLVVEVRAAHPELAADDEAAFAALARLRDGQMLAWTFEFRTTWEPQEELRRRLARIGDEAVREEAMAKLEELDAGRRAVSAAAGEVERLTEAQRALDETFTRLTGSSTTRHAGATYAGRTVVFEDARRDFELVLGRRIIEEVGPALSLVLTSARWLTSELARACSEKFREEYAALSKKRGSSKVPLADLWFRIQRYIHGARGRPLDVVEEELRRRWTALFDPLSDPRRNQLDAAALRPKVAAAFAADGPGWEMARHHSPDLMIGASSVEAIARGEYFAVLGEVHVGLNTIDNAMFASQHPSPREIAEGVYADARAPRVILVPPKHSPHSSVVRESRYALAKDDYEIETGFEGSLLPRARVLAPGRLEVEERDGRLVVELEDGRTLPLLDVMGQTLSESVANSLDMFVERDHSPRVTIDRLVVHRESWRFAADDLAFAALAAEDEGFLGATRWAADSGLPRFVFARSDLEVKPIYVDLESPASVRVFRRLVRRMQEHTGEKTPIKVSEMLPSLDEAWLFDAEGRRYTSELRLAVVDRRPCAARPDLR